MKEYDENIGCISSTLRTENILALAHSDINFGIDIRPTYLCKNCNGYRYDLQNKLKPTFLEHISMKINSIFFSFVLDEVMNYSSIVRIIVLSRFLKKRINLISKLIIDSLLFIIILDIPTFCVMSKPILSIDSIIFILVFYFPFKCLCFFSIKDDFEYMKIIVGSKRMKGKIKDTRDCFTKYLTIFYKLFIYGVTIIIFNVMYFHLMGNIYSKINDSLKESNKSINEFIYSQYFMNLSYIETNIKELSNNSNVLFKSSSSKTSITILELVSLNYENMHNEFTFITILFLFINSAINLDKREHLFSCLTITNYKILLLFFIPVLIWLVIFLNYLMNLDSSFSVRMNFYYIIILFLWFFLMIFIDYLFKIHKKRYHTNKKKNIKLMLETRLGTYSPK